MHVVVVDIFFFAQITQILLEKSLSQLLCHFYLHSYIFYPFRFHLQSQVSFQLRTLAGNKGADEERFNQLADTVESFTYCLLDPIRSNKRWREDVREEFGDVVLDHIIDHGTDLDQKKVFVNPVSGKFSFYL